MTTLHHAVETDRTEPGWLRRAWEAGLANPRIEPRFGKPTSAFLLDGDIPETLEPFISATPAPGLEVGDARILDFEELDGAAASALLSALPEHALEQDFSIHAPPGGITLRAVAENPGTIVAGGSVISPELPGEAIHVRELTIRDPELLAVAPDVVPADLPAWLGELPAADRTDYMKARDGCLEHGTTRQAWALAADRYDIRGARRAPYMRVVTDAETGAQGVWFAW